LYPGNYVVVSVDWPVRSETDVPILLLLSGPVIWSKGDVVGVLVSRYDFETSGHSEAVQQSIPGRYVTASRAIVSTRGKPSAGNKASSVSPVSDAANAKGADS
jgi:hypothetical protein